MDLMHFIFTLAPVVASSDIEGAAAAPLILLASGFIFYWLMYTRYRNADKRHSHERETTSTAANLQSCDTFVKHKKGLSNAAMQGANHNRVEGSLNTSTRNKLLQTLIK
jgi:hypothetical protein